MKKILITLVCIAFSSAIFSQGLYNNGGKIVIGSGVTLFVNGTGGNYLNETSVSGGSMDLSGTFVLYGNLTNNVAASDIFSSTSVSSEVIFAGTAQQTVGGTTNSDFIFPSLTINNASGVLFSKNVLVNGTMTLTNGLANIGNNNFVFGLSSSVAGSPSAASMIVATGTGQVRKEWSSSGSFTFPVGDNNLTTKFSPISLIFISGTFAPGAYTGVNLVNAKYSDPSISGSYLNRYWNISQSGITSFSCNALFQYDPADVVGTETNISNLRVIPIPFTSFNQTNPILHQLTALGLTAFGTFTGGPAFKTLNLNLFLEGLYAGGGKMFQAQGSLGNQYPGTTADQLTIELHDPVTYLTTIYSVPNINLSVDGLASVNIPVTYNNSYYITVKHRNSIDIVSAVPLSFTLPTVNYDFSTSAGQAFGSNEKNLGAGVYGMYGGDTNQDGLIDIGDLIPVEVQAAFAGSGYIPEDVNGDGLVDLTDLILIETNASSATGVITP